MPLSNLIRWSTPVVAMLLVASCSTVRESPKYILSDGVYQFRQHGEKFRKVKVYVIDDSVGIFNDKDQSLHVPEVLKDQFFLKRTFDVDVMTAPFKLRPARPTLPAQLTTDFNGNVFMGYRFDRFRLVHRHTPMGWKRFYKHRALSIGGFAGMGATAVTPWTTNYAITDEYNGLVLSRGLAAMVGISNLTVGVAVGWDNLTDRDKSVWIYQQKPWLGLSLGLNLN